MVTGAFLIGFSVGVLVGLFAGILLTIHRRGAVDTVAETAAPGVMGPAADVPRRCAVCGRAANPVRFHDGRYLCGAHKGAA